MKVLSLQFSYDELISFCRFSQDFNPIHWDKTYTDEHFLASLLFLVCNSKCLALIQEEELFKGYRAVKSRVQKPGFFCDPFLCFGVEHNS